MREGKERGGGKLRQGGWRRAVSLVAESAAGAVQTLAHAIGRLRGSARCFGMGRLGWAARSERTA